MKPSSKHWLFALKFLFIVALFTLSSCSAPQDIEDATTSTLDELDKLGKERQIGKDMKIAPEQEEKVQIRF